MLVHVLVYCTVAGAPESNECHKNGLRKEFCGLCAHLLTPQPHTHWKPHTWAPPPQRASHRAASAFVAEAATGTIAPLILTATALTRRSNRNRWCRIDEAQPVPHAAPDGLPRRCGLAAIVDGQLGGDQIRAGARRAPVSQHLLSGPRAHQRCTEMGRRGGDRAYLLGPYCRGPPLLTHDDRHAARPPCCCRSNTTW